MTPDEILEKLRRALRLIDECGPEFASVSALLVEAIRKYKSSFPDEKGGS